MKKAFLALAAVAMVFATSCKKENVNAPEEPTVYNGDQFVCVIDPTANPQNAPRVDDDMSQKACIDGSNDVWWQVDDQIAYCGQQVKDGQPEGDPKAWYILNCNSTPDNGGAAYFTAQEELHFGQGEHEAYYPASLHTANGLELPQTQAIDPNRNASHLPMYATGSGAHYLTFHNICAVLKITVPTLPSNCFKIVVTNNNNPFCGQFYVDGNKAKISNGVTGENKKHIDVVKTNNSDFTADEVVYVALPEGEYHNVSIQFYGKDGNNNDDLIFGSIIPDMTVHTNCIYPVTVQYRPQFCITALENETITFQQNATTAPTVNLEYCTSSTYGLWQAYFTTSSQTTKFVKTALNKGEKLYVRATTKGNSTFSDASGMRHVFSATGKYAVSGKISYLLDEDGDEPTSLAQNTFWGMFASSNVIDACNLILLNKTSRNCYNKMFNSCGNLCAAPILPARNVSQGSYNNMFAGTKVTSIVLRATSIDNTNAFTNWIKSNSGTIHTTSAAESWFNANSTYTYGWNVITDQN